MSYTQLGYPAAFAAEGNPVKGGFPGDFDPYVHGVNDTMDVDDETGFFSLDVSLISVSFFFFLGFESKVDFCWLAYGTILGAGDCVCGGAGWVG
jgi:hypothetical protein